MPDSSLSEFLLYALPHTYIVKLCIFVANHFLVFHENTQQLYFTLYFFFFICITAK